MERLLAAAADELAAIEPPPEHAAAHGALITYYRDLHAIAVRITAATGAGDTAALPALFDESGRPGTALERALPPELAPLVADLLFID